MVTVGGLFGCVVEYFMRDNNRVTVKARDLLWRIIQAYEQYVAPPY